MCVSSTPSPGRVHAYTCTPLQPVSLLVPVCGAVQHTCVHTHVVTTASLQDMCSRWPDLTDPKQRCLLASLAEITVCWIIAALLSYALCVTKE